MIGVPPKRRIDRAGVVDPVGAARALADEVNARKAGFSPKPPIYAIGSQVNATGVANFKKSRRTWDKLPFVPEGCTKLITQVASEGRQTSSLPPPTSRSTAPRASCTARAATWPASR